MIVCPRTASPEEAEGESGSIALQAIRASNLATRLDGRRHERGVLSASRIGGPKPLRFPFNLVKLLEQQSRAHSGGGLERPLVIAPGPPRMAFLMDPDLVKEVLLTRASDFPKGGLQVEVLKPVFGNAMISVEGREWRWQRGVAAPVFRHEELLRYGPAMTAAAEAAVARWRASEPGTVHPIHTDMMRAAFDVISTTMLAGGAEEVLEAIQKGHSLYYASANWWVLYTLLGLPHWLPRPGGTAMRAHETRLRELRGRIGGIAASAGRWR